MSYNIVKVVENFEVYKKLNGIMYIVILILY